ncbi:transcriptional regulation of mitochondrial recombination-domain-containing protein [Triangularia verruculosa]|uniref:Large ribosomal subunit protein mL67 n=1 Tax=Triangularia verruculosa TaxID=2587418 RepID=A0AAN6XDK4_9PEZI|nr:transcriptional regulation of mitochondrial recombination-domain-containing protein [Triangularia verruculosa]
MNSLCSASRSGMMAARRPLLAMAAAGRRPALGMVTMTAATMTTTTLVKRAAKEALERGTERAPGTAKNFGEKIYLWNHIQANHVLWSTTKELRSNKALRQVTFTGKKNTLLKIRKDYWRPMATIQFPPGEGEVGLSAFHKLVELKKRHELEWDDGGEEAKRLLNLSKIERGREINDQKGNSVADMAHVLAGGGKGNKVVINREELQIWKEMQELEGVMGARRERLEEKQARLEGREEVEEGVKEEEEGVKKEQEGVKEEEAVEEEAVEEELRPEEEPAKQLHKVRVFWANELDHHFAESWSDNVEHVIGLPKEDWTAEDLDALVANQDRLLELHAKLREKVLEKREEKVKAKEKAAAKKAKKAQRFEPTPEGEEGWKSRPRAPKPFTGKAPKWAKEGL